jgi:hypothetical protein
MPIVIGLDEVDPAADPAGAAELQAATVATASTVVTARMGKLS